MKIIMRSRLSLIVLVLLAVLTTSCRTEHRARSAGVPAPRVVVIWLSIDGLRPDYVDRAPTPLFHQFIREGAFSRRLVTTTPSLTFPSHVTEATGVAADRHGIPANDFYDSTTRQSYKFPSVASLLQAEPIWLTAKRQGIRTLVFDWPLSQAETGAITADYFLPGFDDKLTDDQRLARILDRWDADRGDRPLRLLMGYVKETDVVGHRAGPSSMEVVHATERTDGRLREFIGRATEIFKRKMSPQDQLYVLLTTDHGMAPVRTLVNLENLFPTPPPRAAKRVTSGPLGMIYLDQVPDAQREALARSLFGDLRRWNFLAAWRRDQLPPQWHFAHPTRVGDIVVMLRPGYSFSNRLPLPTFPVERVNSPLGMHGYPPSWSPDMLGFCAVWRYPTPLRRGDLGTVHAEQFHPTVSQLLGIKPAPAATAEPLRLNP